MTDTALYMKSRPAVIVADRPAVTMWLWIGKTHVRPDSRKRWGDFANSNIDPAASRFACVTEACILFQDPPPFLNTFELKGHLF
jgi:hypothetical protein